MITEIESDFVCSLLNKYVKDNNIDTKSEKFEQIVNLKQRLYKIAWRGEDESK